MCVERAEWEAGARIHEASYRVGALQSSPPLSPSLPGTAEPEVMHLQAPRDIQPALLRPGFLCDPGWFLSLATQEACMTDDHDHLLGFTLCASLADTVILEDTVRGAACSLSTLGKEIHQETEQDREPGEV